MNTSMTPDYSLQWLTRRAKAKLGWYMHAGIYLVVNAFLFLLSTYGQGQKHWAIYPALGWGVGLALHGISVFALGSGSELRERMIQKERERLQRRRQP